MLCSKLYFHLKHSEIVTTSCGTCFKIHVVSGPEPVTTVLLKVTEWGPPFNSSTPTYLIEITRSPSNDRVDGPNRQTANKLRQCFYFTERKHGWKAKK